MEKLLAIFKGKSKTVNFNAATAATIALLKSFGIELSVETVTAIYTIANIVLRYITTKSLDEK